MYNSFQLTKKFLHYYFTSSNSKGHGIHSPFVFDFILNVLNNKSNYFPPDGIEKLRNELLHDKRIIEIEDLGAGSRISSSKQKSVAQLGKAALKSKKYAQVLFRLVKHYQPENIIELGTSLGITTAYLSKANPHAAITTIEGSAAIATIANENLQKLNSNNIQLMEGNFDSLLSSAISHLPSIDLAYIDGNHRYEPTIHYFDQFLSKSDKDTILVFDDIHWSDEMEKAWDLIKAHPTVKCTIDIFFIGFVFFKNEFKVKQNFSIRF